MSKARAHKPAGRPTNLRHYIQNMGPAWIISAVACGPATISSLSIAGSTFGYKMLWVVFLSALLATATQFLAAKVGILGQKGIINTVDTHLGRLWGWILTLDAALVTWLAAIILMKSLSETTSLITGLHTKLWGPPYAFIFFILLTAGGYRLFEILCKILVCILLASFLGTVCLLDLNGLEIVRGLIPTLPAEPESALVMAGIIGGGVHITIICMHTYTVKARNWSLKEMRLAQFDTVISMLIAFGSFSFIIYIVSAAVLHPAGYTVQSALDVAQSLKPFVGQGAVWIFLFGLWAAIFSTIAPVYAAAAYFISDKLGWDTDHRQTRFKYLIAVGCILSLLGPFWSGEFMPLLVMMLALGLCGTPVVIALILVLLNKRSFTGTAKTSLFLNLSGVIALIVTAFLAARFILVKIGA